MLVMKNSEVKVAKTCTLGWITGVARNATMNNYLHRRIPNGLSNRKED